jgi:hypothetical protein
LKANSWQAIQDSEQRFDALLCSDSKVCDLWIRGAEGGLESLGHESEKLQFAILAKQLIDQFQTHHYQYERGLVEEEMWVTWKSQLEEHVVEWPGLREVLVQRRKYFRPAFGSIVEDYLRENDA